MSKFLREKIHRTVVEEDPKPPLLAKGGEGSSELKVRWTLIDYPVLPVVSLWSQV